MFKSNSLKKRVFAAIIAGTMIMSFSLTGCNNNGDENSNSNPSSTESKEESVKQKFGNDIVIKSKNYKIPYSIMSYLFNYQYQNYLSYYGSYMTYYGFSATKDLKDQYYNEENNETWYDFFMDQTKSYISETLILAEAAKAEGMELSESELKDIEENFKSFSAAAESKSMTEEEYLEKCYGPGVTKDQVKESIKLNTLAQKYYDKVYNNFKYSDSDYEKYYEENKTSYQYADFLTYVFTADYDKDATDEEKKAANEKAKAYAEDLSKCKTEAEFKASVKKYLQQNPNLVTESTTSTESSVEESSMTDEDIAEAIDAKVEATLKKKYAYEVTSEIGKWAFDGGRNTLDTTVVNDGDSYTVAMLIKPAYRDETLGKNVRHILIQSSSYSSDEDAKAKAEEIYNKWKSGEKTEQSFANLATEYTEDGGSKATGGLYENISEGKMVPEFNDWCFDSSRKPGDTDIIKTTYGYHIMYFSSDGEVMWKSNVDETMRKEDFTKKYNELQKQYEVEYDDDYLNTISLFETSNESSAQ